MIGSSGWSLSCLSNRASSSLLQREYEIEKKLLGGRLSRWPTIMADLRLAVSAIDLGEDIARQAARIGRKYGLPGLDSLILATLLDAKVKCIYTTDAHFELYQGKGVEIINLAK